MSIKVGVREFDDVKSLEELVVHCATMYDVDGYAEDFDGLEVTDPEYDDLYRTLKKLNPAADALKGTKPSTAKPKGKTVTHDPPMTSIEKADGEESEKKAIYEKWIARCAADLGVSVKDLKIAQSYKRDGVAVRINYVKGKLVSAGLRPRDGINGTDVTEHIKHVKGVPLQLPLPLTLSLGGEIECWLDDFEAVNAECDAQGDDRYKNPRNYTAGCMGRDDASEVKNAGLRICFYGITGFDEWRDYYATEVERAKWANGEEGLNLQEGGKGYFVQVRPHDFRHLALMEQHAKKLPYYTDGIVLKVDNLEWQEDLGHLGGDPVNPPVGALAWKFAEETAEAEVSSVEWNASRTGRVVPTAIFDTPFILADTENSRATCNNYGWMKSQGLGPGALVRCKKGGKIIPNIMEVLKPVKHVGAPKNCPTCNALLTLQTSTSGNTDLICPNTDCGSKHVKGWCFFITKIGGKGLGTSAMEKILHTGKVRSLADLFNLKEADLTAAGFSERQATLALATIYSVTPEKDNDALKAKIEVARKGKLEIEAWKFFSALGIPGAGESVGKALVQYFRAFDPIRQASKDDLTAVAGVGSTTAAAIRDWFDARDDVVEKLLGRFNLQLPKSGKLTGKNFCLTGSFTLGKKHWQALIEAEGGNVTSSFSKNTHYLVQEHGKTDGSLSDKEKAAAKAGVPVLRIPDLEKML